MAPVSTTARKDLNENLLAYETYKEYVLADALDGNFDPESDNAAAAAFAMGQIKALKALCELRERDVEFLEAPEVLARAVKGMEPRKKGDKKVAVTVEMLTPAERSEILKATPGTRAFARVKLEAATPHPFA
jgi:hypothetical protein